MSSQSLSQLITVNLQYNGIKITKQCSDVSCIWTEYGDIQSKSPYSRRMWRNTGQTNPECEHFSRS